MVRRVHREYVVGLAGPRTLLLQATHPVAFAGFFAHTGALDEPYERLARTAQVMDAIAFGPRAEADRADPARPRHAPPRPGRAGRAGGALPGRHALRRRRPGAAAVDPRGDRRLLAARLRQVRAPPEPRRARRLLAGLQAHRARSSGCADAEMPDDDRGLRRLHGATCSRAATSTSRRRRASWRSRSSCARRCRCSVRPLLELANQITVGLLPGEIRRGYGLSWDPARSVALHGGAEYVRRVVVPLLPSRLPRARRGLAPERLAREPRPRCARAAPRRCAARRGARSRGRA